MKNTITQNEIDELFNNSEVKYWTVFDKCTVMAVKLPNGFVLTESSACVSPTNYDESLGIKICEERIKNRLWELEGYNLQNTLSKRPKSHTELASKVDELSPESKKIYDTLLSAILGNVNIPTMHSSTKVEDDYFSAFDAPFNN